jgi:ABC-2 type transport system permease protein
MIAMRKYVWVGLTSARSNMAYLTEIASRLIFLGIILYIFLQLWKLTFRETGAAQLGGLTLAQMMWYLTMTEALTLSRSRITDETDSDVRTGALAIQLIRPISYPLYRLWTNLGERVVKFAFNLVIGSIVVTLFVGPIPFTPGGILLFLLTLPIAFVVDFLGLFLIGLGAFWLEDTSGLWLIYSRVTMILGGMLIPVELFPDWMQPIVRALPFSSVVYGPARMFVHPELNFLIELLIRQGIALGIFALLVTLVYRISVKRINANGG